jgi:PAS domain S-box-containing protein
MRAALRRTEVDAIIGDRDVAYVRLKQMQDTLRGAQETLERQVEAHAEEMGEAGRQVREALEAQKQAQQQLAEYTKLMQRQAELLDLAYDVIVVRDIRGKILFWNRGAEDTYGWKRQDVLGKNLNDLLRTEYVEPFIKVLGNFIRDERWEGQVIHTTQDGRKIAVDTRWALRKDADGRPEAILQIERDITHDDRETTP